VSWYQKGKTSLDLLEQETVRGICITPQSPRQITSIPTFRFLQAGCPSCRQTNSVNSKHWRTYSSNYSCERCCVSV